MKKEDNKIQRYDTEEVLAQKNYRLAVPFADIFASENGYRIDVDMPGVSKDKFSVKVDHDELLVKGEIDKTIEKDYYFNEMNYSGFERTFVLPADVDIDKIEASYNNGVLSITLNKKEEYKPKLIEIKWLSF